MKREIKASSNARIVPRWSASTFVACLPNDPTKGGGGDNSVINTNHGQTDSRTPGINWGNCDRRSLDSSRTLADREIASPGERMGLMGRIGLMGLMENDAANAIILMFATSVPFVTFVPFFQPIHSHPVTARSVFAQGASPDIVPSLKERCIDRLCR